MAPGLTTRWSPPPPRSPRRQKVSHRENGDRCMTALDRPDVSVSGNGGQSAATAVGERQHWAAVLAAGGMVSVVLLALSLVLPLSVPFKTEKSGADVVGVLIARR